METNIPYLSITEVVEDYCASSFNNDRKYFENYLIHAKWLWKDLMKFTLVAVKHKYLPIDKSTTPHSVKLPKDLVRFFNVSFADGHGNILNLLEDHRMNTTPVPTAGGGCGCGKCDCDSELCGASSQFSVRQRDVEIDGKVYQEKIWNKRLPSGAILEVRSTPLKDYHDQDSYTIRFHETERQICQLDVKPCGCVKATDHNHAQLRTLGCFSACGGHAVQPVHHGESAVGLFKVENGRVWIQRYSKELTHVILSYQTNGECGCEEIMIPEYAVETMHFGIHYRAAALSPASGRLNIREHRKEYKARENELMEFLNPIRIEDFLRYQDSFANGWGDHGGAIITVLDGGEKKASLSDIAKMLDAKLKNFSSASGLDPAMDMPPLPFINYAFVHYQDIAATVWEFTHDLSFYPNMTIVDENGIELDPGEKQYVSTNTIRLTFSEALTGYVYLS